MVGPGFRKGWALSFILLAALPLRAGQETPGRVRTEIPYRDGTVVLQSEFQERVSKTRYRARGHVEITYQDMVISCDEAEYDEATRQGFTTGTTRFSQNKQWLTCSRAEFDFANQTGTFYEATGFTDAQFLIEGKTIRKTGRDVYTIESGLLTSCQEKRPKWSFELARGQVRVDRTARMKHVLFRIKGVPVFYFPYVIMPMEKKERSSGFLPFHYGTSTSKGRVFQQGYYQTLGPSADATLYGEYYSLRGLGVGGIFRARPNKDTRLFLQAFGVNDKLDQGGAHLILDGETYFARDFRAVANVNVTSNFKFRQAFSDTFRSATIPLEQASAFATRNRGSSSLNIAFDRQEILFPGRSLVIRKAPSFEFFSLGEPLGQLPLTFYLRTSAEAVSRVDHEIETPGVMQRFDLHPAVSLRLPAFAGFSVIPTAGFRETYYSARLSTSDDPEVLPRGIRREYAEFELDVRTPTLEKSFDSSLGRFKHIVEPVISYRRIRGIDQLDEIIRFDAEDAVADTNELEYGLANRILRSRKTRSGGEQEFEFLYLGLFQKYFFDPTFGGAFHEGEPNMFYPLNTLTGFSLTAIQRRLAPTSLMFRLSPNPGVSWDVRADYDQQLDRLRDASVSTYWHQGELFVAATYFKTNALEPGTFDSHHIQGQAGFGSVTRGLSASATLSYNIRTRNLLNSHSRLNYAWDCCGVAFEFQQYDLGQRIETRFSFSFILKGLGSFGNLKRPESLF